MLAHLGDSGFYGLHQILKIGEYVSVGLVAVLGHQIAVYDNVELAVGTWCELEVIDVFAGSAQCFACHPGSARCVPSILAV